MVVLFLVAVVQHIPFSLLGEQRDSGELLLNARDIVQGGLPYTSSYSVKTPGAPYIMAGCMALFGESLLAQRVLVFLVNVLGAWGTACLCRVLGWRGRTAFLAG